MYPSRPDMTAPDNSDDFLVAEYNRLSAEIAELNKESSNCITFTLSASVGLWTWLLSSETTAYTSLIIALPAMATVMWFVRWLMLAQSMGEIGFYLAKTELLYFENRHGWENYIRLGGKRTGMKGVGKWKLAYFVLILGLNLVMACKVYHSSLVAQSEDQKHRQELKVVVEKLADLLTKGIKAENQSR
jgi:hypothetical protein